MLLIGSIIKTSYSENLHKVIEIKNDCECPRETDVLGLTNSGFIKKSPNHSHIVCIDLQDKMKSYFNGYMVDDFKIINIWRSGDELLIISEPKNVQLKLF